MANGINKPLTTRGQKTFDALTKSAISLFHTKGYHQTTIAEIAAEAGVGVGTFYIYFNDKYSLYRHVLLEFGRQIRTRIAQAIKNTTTREEAEREGMKAYIKYIRDFPYAYTVIWQSLQVDKALFVDYYRDFAARYQKMLIAHKEEILTDDYLTLSYALMGISNFVGLQVNLLEHDLKNDESIDELVDKLFDAFKKGLFREKI